MADSKDQKPYSRRKFIKNMTSGVLTTGVALQLTRPMQSLAEKTEKMTLTQSGLEKLTITLNGKMVSTKDCRTV